MRIGDRMTEFTKPLNLKFVFVALVMMRFWLTRFIALRTSGWADHSSNSQLVSDGIIGFTARNRFGGALVFALVKSDAEFVFVSPSLIGYAL